MCLVQDHNSKGINFKPLTCHLAVLHSTTSSSRSKYLMFGQPNQCISSACTYTSVNITVTQLFKCFCRNPLTVDEFMTEGDDRQVESTGQGLCCSSSPGGRSRGYGGFGCRTLTQVFVYTTGIN